MTATSRAKGVKGIIPNAKLGAGLVAALRELPKTRRALSDKPRLYDGVHLELSAAEMQDGEFRDQILTSMFRRRSARQY